MPLKTQNDQMSYQDHASATEVNAAATAERRELHDRRRHGWRTVTYCGLEGRGRRRCARRNGYDYYLDWYDPKLVFTGIAILVMSYLDALFSLVLLDRGADEANIFMARLMGTSDELFIAVKLLVTALAIIFLMMHAHFRIWRIFSGKHLLQAVVILYGMLIGYELILLAIVEGN
jgi:hypothetical protein